MSRASPYQRSDPESSTSYMKPTSYTCRYESCGRSFTRKDHLLRHAANHEKTSLHCRTCRRGFKRQDLLYRHEKRAACGGLHGGQRKRSPMSEDGSLPGKSVSHIQHQVGPGENKTLSPPDGNNYSSPVEYEDQAFHAQGDRQGGKMDLEQPSDPNALLHNLVSRSHHAELPPPTPVYNAGSSHGITGTTFESTISPSGWDSTAWHADPWESMLQEFLSGAVNDGSAAAAAAADTVQDPPWFTDPPNRADVPLTADEILNVGSSVSDAALLARIDALIPELQWDSSFLIDALATYWTHVAPTFPFIHRGTFDLETATPQLLVLMAIVGARYMPLQTPRDYSVAVRRIRCGLYLECGLDMPVSTLQAFCLCHVYDTWYGTAETQFVAQCMWPVMVAYTRKKGIGVVGRAENEADEEEAWAAWAKDEERRRAAFSVLLCDTQISAFWNQHSSRQLSIFAHDITLPCPRDEWNALSASEWIKLRVAASSASRTTSRVSAASRSGYLPGLHPEFQVNTVNDGFSASLLTALAAETSYPFRVDFDGYLGVEMILMGMMAVAWDCRTRGGMGIKFREGTKQWRPIVLKAITQLRGFWESSVSHLSPGVEIRDMRDTFAMSIVSVLSDIPMLQVAAGATAVCGTSIGPRQYKDAQRRLRMWGRSEDAWLCLWQSSRYLRQVLFAEWGIYSSWAVFLTTLVHWAYAWSLARDAEELLPPTYSPHSRATRLLDTILASSERLDGLNQGVGDLIVCAAERLIDTDIDRDCAGLLWRLVGTNYTKRPVI